MESPGDNIDSQSIGSVSDTKSASKKGPREIVEDLKKQLKQEKKLKKVLKEALTQEQEKSRALEREAERLRQRVEEVEREKRDKENKYLDLYMENTQQHEMIVALQSQLKSGEQSHDVSDYQSHILAISPAQSGSFYRC